MPAYGVQNVFSQFSVVAVLVLACNHFASAGGCWAQVGAYRLPTRVRPLDEVPVFAAWFLLLSVSAGIPKTDSGWIEHQARALAWT